MQLVMFRPAGASPRPTPAPPGLRLASSADADKLASLLAISFPEEIWVAARVIRDLIDAPDVPATFVMEHSGKLIGTASVRYMDRFPNSGYVHWVAVHPDARGQRLAVVLMDAVARVFSSDSRHSAVLETDDTRLPAISSYLGQGFVPHYLDDDHELRWSRVFQALTQHRLSKKGH